jgi:chromosome partitioning protein
VRVGVVANRVRQNTRVYQKLQRFLDTLQIPFVAQLRDTQMYVNSAEEGMGINELPAKQIHKDRVQWKRLMQWIDGVPE